MTCPKIPVREHPHPANRVAFLAVGNLVVPDQVRFRAALAVVTRVIRQGAQRALQPGLWRRIGVRLP